MESDTPSLDSFIKMKKELDEKWAWDSEAIIMEAVELELKNNLKPEEYKKLIEGRSNV